MRPVWFAALLAVVACHSPGPYSHSVQYAPSVEEAHATGAAREYDPIMFQRQMEKWRGKPVTLLGVVTARAPGPGGGAYLTLGVRRLEARNLCESNNDEDSCRVTVSDADFGVVHAVARLAGEDDVGALSVGPGSLVRLVGAFGEDVDPGDGAPVLRATFYRHFPRGYYVTKAAAGTMRQ